MSKFAFLALVLLASGCRPERTSNASYDETAIKTTSDAYTEAFNKNDANKFASLWKDDGVYNNFSDKETLVGKNEVAVYFKELFQKEPGISIKLGINSITFQSPEKATVNGKAQIRHRDRTSDQIAFRAEYVKENDTWLLQKISEVNLLAAPSNFEHLKELNWLVGSWEDVGENVSVTSTYTWDTNKNFLTQHFIMKVLDQKELEGVQIIGWDPIKKKIRSWVFDSDGGFGESYWSNDGNSWYAALVFTLTDGKKSTATHVITKVDNNSYTFSSVGRDIDGRILPDIGPFKAVRK